MEENAVASPGTHSGGEQGSMPEPHAHPDPVCQLLVPGMGQLHGLAQVGSGTSWGQAYRQQPPLQT